MKVKHTSSPTHGGTKYRRTQYHRPLGPSVGYDYNQFKGANPFSVPLRDPSQDYNTVTTHKTRYKNGPSHSWSKLPERLAKESKNLLGLRAGQRLAVPHLSAKEVEILIRWQRKICPNSILQISDDVIVVLSV